MVGGLLIKGRSGMRMKSCPFDHSYNWAVREGSEFRGKVMNKIMSRRTMCFSITN